MAFLQKFPRRSLNNAVLGASRRFFASRVCKVDNPYTGDTFCEVPYLTEAEATQKITRAQKTFDSWRHSSLQERIELCNKWISEIRSREGQLAADVTGQMGKPLKQAIGEVKTLVARTEALIEMAPAALKDLELPANEGFKKKITREPIGPVLCLSPWNYPLICSVNTVIAAVLAGNSVILKHSDRSPLCAQHFSETFKAVGAPEGLVQDLHVDHDTVGRLLAHPALAYVSFTGSVQGGRQVYQKVGASRFIDVGLELGGKDPAYVAKDADLNQAIEGLVDGACYNAGQSCCSVERVYVHRSLYKDFVEGAAKVMGGYVMGDPLADSTSMGPIAQPHHPAFLSKQIEEAVQRGARLVTGGKATTDAAGKGRFFQPTLLADCTHQMSVMRDESFGPILPVVPVDSDQQAIQMMNDSEFGLTAAVFSKDEAHAEELAKQLDAGTVFMNRCDFLDPYLPWSGRKDSGKGIGLSQLGFAPFTRTKGYNFRL